MNRRLLADYGLKYGVVAGGTTAGAAVGVARVTPVATGAVALGLLGVAGVLLVLTIGGTGTSTAAMANQPGQSAVADPEDAGAGSKPGRGVRVFCFALGLAAWTVVVLGALTL